MRRPILILVALAAAAGCSIFHDSYPDKSCETNADCFLGRELCNTATKQCEPIDLPDAAGPQPDAPPTPDAPAAPDAAVDAAAIDAEVPDAT